MRGVIVDSAADDRPEWVQRGTWVHRVIRAAVRPLAYTPVTPNHLTTMRLLTGLAAAAAFADGSEEGRQLGAWIFLLSLAFDHADGELARLTGKTSRWGHTYDIITDGACNALVFVGLGMGLAGPALGAWPLVVGLVAGLTIAAVFALTLLLEMREGPHAGELQGTGGLDPDQGMLAVPIAVWLGWAPWLVAAAGVGAPLFALFYAWKFRQRLMPHRA